MLALSFHLLCYYSFLILFLTIVYIMDIRPGHTIYINNLNEKIKKEGQWFIFLSYQVICLLWVSI